MSLARYIEHRRAVLRFGGGCQGFSAFDLTLKPGVGKAQLEQLSQIAGVRDVTDHSDRSKAYYRMTPWAGFPAEHSLMPSQGYTKLFARIVDMS